MNICRQIDSLQDLHAVSSHRSFAAGNRLSARLSKPLVEYLPPGRCGSAARNSAAHQITVSVDEERGRNKGDIAHKGVVEHGGGGDIHFIRCTCFVDNALNGRYVAGSVHRNADDVYTFALKLLV